MRLDVEIHKQRDARLRALAASVLDALQKQDRLHPIGDLRTAAHWLTYGLQHPDLHVYRFDAFVEVHHRRRLLLTIRPLP
jgi:hypothetical protein